MVKKLHSLFFVFFSSFCLIACDQAEDSVNYLDEPRSRIGHKLYNQTSEIDKIASDTAYFLNDNLEVTEIAYLSSKGQPVKLFLFEIYLSEELSIETSMPNNDTVFDMQPMSIQAQYRDSTENAVLGGVNGDFYNMTTGSPSGIFVANGEVLKETFLHSDYFFFAMTKDGKPMIAQNSQFQSLKPQIKEGIGGSIRLLKDGEIVSEKSQPDPRTAVGISSDGSKVFLMVVDGRNWSYSAGMDYISLATVMRELGASNAINLDGGGSSTFFVRNMSNHPFPPFLIRNFPSDEEGERPVANGLLILSKDIQN